MVVKVGYNHDLKTWDVYKLNHKESTDYQYIGSYPTPEQAAEKCREVLLSFPESPE